MKGGTVSMKRCIWVAVLGFLIVLMQTALADTAVIDGKTADKVHLREGRSTDQDSIGLYFSGTQVQCESSPVGEWTAVTIGDQTGYMMEKYLVRSDGRDIFPTMQQGSIKADCQLRQGTTYRSAVVMALNGGTAVTVLGETHDGWFYVQVNGLYGYIEPGYLNDLQTVTRKFPFVADTWWRFSSGSGAWQTTLHVSSDGAFSGLFEDVDMGDVGEDYPNGTQYISRFSGCFETMTQVAEGMYYGQVESLTWEGTADEVAYVDGVRVITREPYGISQGDGFLLCAQGVDIGYLTENQRIWVQDNLSEGKVACPVLINQTEDWGFCWIK